MTTEKLPKTQAAVLQAIDSGVSVRFVPTYGGRGLNYWVRSDTDEKVTAAVRALLKRGLVQRLNRDGRAGFWTLVRKQS
jgi:hypothetical protein